LELARKNFLKIPRFPLLEKIEKIHL